MRTILCLLLVAGFASAQPIHGPYVVHASNVAIGDLEVCVRGDTVDAVWIEDNHALWQRFSLVSQAPVRELDTTLALNTWPHLELHDLTARNDSSWCCVVYQDERLNPGVPGELHNIVSLLVTESDEPHLLELATGITEQGYTTRGVSPPSGFSVSNTAEGRIGIAWTYAFCDLRWTTLYMRASHINNDLTPLWIDSGEYGFSFFDLYSNALVINSHEDSLTVISTSPYGGALGACKFPNGELNEMCLYQVGPNFSVFAFLELGNLTGSDALMLYTQSEGNRNPALCRVSIDDTLALTADSLGPIDLDNVSSSFFHRNYGFAVLQVLPNNLLLARIDTAGQTVQPVGVIYESTLGTNIADADVTITDDGKVVVVWSEVSDWNDGPRTLRIAWTDWHELLDAPNEGFLALPREISLSSFPNPFNSTVTIKYDLPQAGHAKLTAYDLQGRTVATLFDDFAPAGSTELHWAPENLASGVYFITLEAPLARATQKSLYLK